MNRIVSVELDGFKGQHRTFELGARTVLSGPNGLGKSAVLEALRYALSGEVPSGKTNDAVSEYFPERGGTVTVTDDSGAFIRRGIKRDHEKKQVSTVFEQEGDAEWLANEALLDMRGFLALSPNKRREFVLELVGAGEAPTDLEVHNFLARDYARQIGGPGADVSILTDRLDELPEEIQPVAGRWLSIWGVLSSYLRTGENTASALFQRLAEASRERKNSSQRAATEAKQAKRELEAAAKGAGAAAAELDKRRYEAEAAVDTFGAAREEGARREQAQVAVDAEDRDRAELASKVELYEGAVLEDPGERPELDTAPIAEAQTLRDEANDIQKAANEIMAQLQKLEAAKDYLSVSRGVLEQVEGEMETLVAEPIGRAVALADQIRHTKFKKIEIDSASMARVCELLQVVDELAESWKVRRENTSVSLAECAIRVRDDEEKHHKLETSMDTGRPQLAELGLREVDIEDKVSALDIANADRIEAEKKALEEWEAKTNRATEVRTESKNVRERYEATRTRHAELVEKLAAMPDPPLLALEEDVLAAREALQEAEEAAGEVKAYEEAVARAASEKVAHKAWSAVEKSSKRAREQYVADIVRPLVDDVAALLADAGRQESVYLRLENDRKQPVFELGWTLGDSRRSLAVLSGGEAALFTTALALTIARRSAGRRVLLIEADPLDEENLEQLLTALAGVDELDACLVATSSDVPAADGWTCVQFARDGTFQTDGYLRCAVVPTESEAPHGGTESKATTRERFAKDGVEIVDAPGETPTETAERILSETPEVVGGSSDGEV